jgi:hypothetical protein
MPVVAALLVVFALVVAGCGGAGPTATPSPSAQPQPLECDVEAFPCSFAEVEQDVRAETERLVDEATRRVIEGASSEELVAWLDSEPTVAEVDGDADSIRFRPTGGRGVWISRRAVGVAVSSSLNPYAIAQVGSWDKSMTSALTNETVTGPGRTERRALVLSPYKWDFGESDDGQAVAQRLGEIPEYANGVTYAENAAIASTDVTADDFSGWRELQVVHVVSHGMRQCRDGKCRAVLAANALPGAVADIWPSGTRGLELEVVVEPPTPAEPSPRPRHNALLGADFFRDVYRGGLDDTVVFLNGCATFGPGATDLADAIRGDTSVVLGWSRPVDNVAAESAAAALYEELAAKGTTVSEALERLGDLANSQSQDGDGQMVATTLSSSGRELGGDLRIRDVVEFQDTEAGGPLIEGAAVQLVGEPDDGAPDSVGWQLRVDGIEAQAAASAVVQVTIDGHAATPLAVSTGTPDAADSWLLSGTLDLGVDVSAPHPARFEATLVLPEGGESSDIVDAVLVGAAGPTPSSGPWMGTIWRGEATERREQPSAGVWTVAEAELVFSLRRRSDDLPIFAYELTGGTLTYSVSGTRQDGCTYDLPPTEITITPEMAKSAGEFVIDARNSPPTFYGFIFVTGPVVEVMQTCPEPYAYLTGPYSTGANAVFMDVSPDEGRTVVGDRIAGTSSDGAIEFDIGRSE